MFDDYQQDPRKSWHECCKRQTTLRALRLEDFFKNVSDGWHEAAMKNDFSTLDEVKKLPATLTPDNYTKTMRTLLKMEEAHEHINRRKFDMFNQKLSMQYQDSEKGWPRNLCYYGIKVEGLSSGQPNLVVNDFVIVHKPPDTYKALKIVSIKNDLVLLKNYMFGCYEELLSGRLDIFFVSGGILHKYYERALNRFTVDRSMMGRLFERESDYLEVDFIYNGAEVDSAGAGEMMNRLNECQRQAINNILRGTSWPKPYILFGPPGTGKTHTLAVAIGQIYAAQPRKRVLYCANSNTCANQMVDKLRMTKFIRPRDIVRLFAGERPEGVGYGRIVLTTNMKASSIMDNYRFDYVFIDEAAHAHEAETLIPIACLRHFGILVLAGDPKQLGAVVQCNLAIEYGLAKSMLERIFSFEVYQRDKVSGKYDSRYITKLVVSYRCDPRVLAISNELFYDGELECPNETPKSLMKIMRIANPLQLFFVRGCDERPANSTSWCNDKEAECCVNQIVRLYKMGLTPDQIGVISPYKLQTNLIYRKLNDRLETMRYFLERRFGEVELVRQVKRKKKSLDDPGTSSITFDLEKLKLGGEEEFDLGKQRNELDQSQETEHEMVEVIKKRSDKWICKIDSVDAFQGDEREVIIMSTVRTPMSSGRKDFINDSRRFNVAISRAKWLVFVIGHKDVLALQRNWVEFVTRASEGVSHWPEQSIDDSSHPYKQLSPLFW